MFSTTTQWPTFWPSLRDWELRAESVGHVEGFPKPMGETAAFALMASIGADGHPTPETVELLLDATMRLADDDAHRQAEAASFLATLTGCLAQVAAQCSRELQNRGIELDWRSN